MKKNKVEIYTDGACSGNPGPGGWGVLLIYNNTEKELSGFEPETTNNRMELRATIEALKAITRPVEIILYTDSTYVKDGITVWIKDWQKNNWKNSQKKPVKNADLWQELLKQTKSHTIDWQWVRGHDGNPGNERADQLARAAIANEMLE